MESIWRNRNYSERRYESESDKGRTEGGGGDPTKLGRWTWTRIGGKDGITTVFVSAYRPCHNPNGLHTVWRQQAKYFKENEDIRNPDVHTLFIRDFCKFLGDLRDEGNNVVLGMDANDDVRNRESKKGSMGSRNV